MMQTYDDYISVEIDQYEVCFGLYHGSARWDFWQDTGFEFNIMEEVELVFQEAIDQDGMIVVKLPKEIVDKAEDIAAELYWDRYAEGVYN